MSVEMRLLPLALGALCCANAWAIQRCELNGESVSPYNGHTTAGKSGVMRCVDEEGRLQRLTVLGEQGRVVRSEEIKDGRRIKRVFYPSGQLRSETDFIERDPRSAGGREGIAREWAESGQLTQETAWADGYEQRIQQWYLNGKQKLRQQIHRQGREQERSTESFWDNGKPAAINAERNGRLWGWQKYFSEEGVLLREDEHGERGRLLRRKRYNAQGVLEREERFLEDGSRI